MEGFEPKTRVRYKGNRQPTTGVVVAVFEDRIVVAWDDGYIDYPGVGNVYDADELEVDERYVEVNPGQWQRTSN